MTQASLFIATFDMPRHLELVLAGVRSQSVQDFEILVCDDGSGPETQVIIKNAQVHFGDRLRIFTQEHQGFRKCRILNQALRATQGEYCIFLDGDCIPHPRFVEDHLARAHPKKFLAGRRVELGQEISGLLDPEKIAKGYLRWPRLEVIKSALSGETEFLNRTVRVPWEPLRRVLRMNRIADMKGCNYSVARSSLLAINGFDEEYEGYGREDTDVELRLQHLGLEIGSLKGVALQYHVWHPRREFTPVNDTRLEELKRSKRIHCRQGLTTLTDAEGRDLASKI